MRRRRRWGGAAAAAMACALAAAGCGGKPPSIAAVEWRLESRPADEGQYESLSAFAWIKADDGIETIEEVWIVNDAAALGWRMTSADWILSREGGDAWIGGSALASPDFGGLPRGSWRMIAIDSAGSRAEREFKIDGAFPARSAPAPRLNSGVLSSISSWPETLAIAYDATGAMAGSAPAPSVPTKLDDLLGTEAAARASEIALYGYDPALRMGSFSRRIPTR